MSSLAWLSSVALPLLLAQDAAKPADGGGSILNTILAVVVVVLLVAGVIAFAWWRTKARDEAFAEAAKMLGGKVEGGGLFSSPQIVFTKDGIQGVVELGKHPKEFAPRQPEQDFTQFTATIPPHDLEIYPTTLLDMAGALVGWAGVTTGDTAFDGRFTTRSGDVNRTKAALTQAVRAGMLELVPQAYMEDVYVKSEGGKFKLQILGHLSEPARLARFGEIGLTLAKAAAGRA
jgi:hypothetical protein